MFEGVTEKLVDSVMRARFSDLPKETVDKTKLMLIDTVGCALAGYITDRVKLAIELVEESGGNPQASIIGGHRTSHDLAAFVNGELINALDYDCVGPLIGHVCPYATPPCLAIAEKVQASGKELITALALAHEIGGRVGTSLAQHKVLKDEPPYFEDSPRFSYSTTLLGGVAGACKLLGLNANKTASALGIAGASSPVPAGIKWFYNSGPAIMVKYGAWSGWGSKLATNAALLADKGFTGDTTILDGEQGFWQIVGSPFFKVDILLGGLGEVWHIEEIEFKPYPTCRVHHAGIEGINQIMQENRIKPEEIDEIVIKGDPFLQSGNRVVIKIESFADMQFSSANIYAVAACYGDRPSPAWQMPVVYDDPKVKALAQKVRIETHPQTEELITSRVKVDKPPAIWDTIVQITARGKKFTSEVTEPKGVSTNQMTEAELVEKFMVNASYSMLPTSKAEQIVQTITNLEKLDDITKLARLLTITD